MKSKHQILAATLLCCAGIIMTINGTLGGGLLLVGGIAWFVVARILK